jgi:RNA polymerase sigma-70 factor (ECF subfamily)
MSLQTGPIATTGLPKQEHPLMSVGTNGMSKTRVSLLERVCDLRDDRSWSEFDAIYRPLIFGYLRGLRIQEHDAYDLTQAVFWRLMVSLPRFKLNRQRGRFRTYLWRLTYNTLVDRARQRKVRGRAEEEWVRRFREADESESRMLEQTFLLRHRQRILEVALSRVRAEVSPTAWACFEGRLVRRRPAAEIAAELGITPNAVHVYTSRVRKEVRRRCAEVEGEQGDGCDLDLSRRG